MYQNNYTKQELIAYFKEERPDLGTREGGGNVNRMKSGRWRAQHTFCGYVQGATFKTEAEAWQWWNYYEYGRGITTRSYYGQVD